MTTLKAEDLAKLRELAQKATPGPWAVDQQCTVGPVSDEDDQTYGMVISLADVYGEQPLVDAAFIAAANPAAILALVKDASRYRAWRACVLTEDESFVTAMDAALPEEAQGDRFPTADEWDAGIDAAIATQGESNV